MAAVNRAAEMFREVSKLLEEEANALQHQSTESARPSTGNSAATKSRDDNSSASALRPGLNEMVQTLV